VTASGDKLLGGPQAGLLLGRADLVQRIRRHPLARAVRVDKLTLAALEATLRGHRPPVLAALEAAPDQLRTRAERLAADLVTAGLDAEGVASEAAVGGGGAPAVVLPSAALALPTALVEPLRAPAVAGVPPVVGRVERGRCLLDLRTVPPERDDDLLAAVLVAAQAAGLRS
jgi:L-seryl-tRNA(Ser) seleniumtransferase